MLSLSTHKTKMLTKSTARRSARNSNCWEIIVSRFKSLKSTHKKHFVCNHVRPPVVKKLKLKKKACNRATRRMGVDSSKKKKREQATHEPRVEKRDKLKHSTVNTQTESIKKTKTIEKKINIECKKHVSHQEFIHSHFCRILHGAECLRRWVEFQNFFCTIFIYTRRCFFGAIARDVREQKWDFFFDDFTCMQISLRVTMRIDTDSHFFLRLSSYFHFLKWCELSTCYQTERERFSVSTWLDRTCASRQRFPAQLISCVVSFCPWTFSSSREIHTKNVSRSQSSSVFMRRR